MGVGLIFKKLGVEHIVNIYFEYILSDYVYIGKLNLSNNGFQGTTLAIALFELSYLIIMSNFLQNICKQTYR